MTGLGAAWVLNNLRSLKFNEQPCTASPTCGFSYKVLLSCKAQTILRVNRQKFGEKKWEQVLQFVAESAALKNNNEK